MLAIISLSPGSQSTSAVAPKGGIFKEGQVWMISWKAGKRQVTIPKTFMEEDGRNGLYEFIGSQEKQGILTRAVQWAIGNTEKIPPHAFIRVRAENNSPSATIKNAMNDLVYCIVKNPAPVQKGQSLTGVLGVGADNNEVIANNVTLYVTSNKSVPLAPCKMTLVK